MTFFYTSCRLRDQSPRLRGYKRHQSEGSPQSSPLLSEASTPTLYRSRSRSHSASRSRHPSLRASSAGKIQTQVESFISSEGGSASSTGKNNLQKKLKKDAIDLTDSRLLSKAISSQVSGDAIHRLDLSRVGSNNDPLCQLSKQHSNADASALATVSSANLSSAIVSARLNGIVHSPLSEGGFDKRQT